MYSDYASMLLKNFVEHCSKLYGREMIVYNIHSLIHLADDATKFGALDRISSFLFENFLGSLIRMVRKPGRPLEQVIQRICERKSIPQQSFTDSSSLKLAKPYYTGYVPHNVGVCTQYKEVHLKGVVINIRPGDNCVCVADGIVLVLSIICFNGEVQFVC